jgi:hypothetical protein
MGVELAPVEAMLDEMYQSLPTSRDKNSYTLGRMGAHNVVIAVMPEIGNNSSVRQLRSGSSSGLHRTEH